MTRDDKITFAVIGLPMVVLFVLLLRDVYAFGVDDSYIFFRYAENLAKRHGFVFNPGEPPGEGFTSWIWLLLLTLCRSMGVDIILASKILGVFFHLAGGLVIYRMVIQLVGEDHESLAKTSALILSGSFLLNYRLIAHSVSGMETSLYVLSMILLIYWTTLALQAPRRDERWWLFISLAAVGAFLVRPEGIVAGGISLLALALHQRNNLQKPKAWIYLLVGLILPFTFFVAWKFMIFGHPLPIPYYHKLIVITEEYGESVRHMLLFFKSYWWLMALAAGTMIYARHSAKGNRILLYYYPAFFLIMVSVYLPFYPAMNYLHRFYIPYLPLLLALLATGIYVMAGKTSFEKPGRRAVFAFLILLLLVAGMNYQMKTPRSRIRGWSKLVDPQARDSRAKLGKLMSHLPPDVVVANTEMGVIPFYSGLPCIDMAGLTDPYTAHRGLSMEYLQQRKAELILFPRDVRTMSTNDWAQYTHPYGQVFLANAFTKNFECVGWYANYYLFANKRSPRYNVIEKWGVKFLRPAPRKVKPS